VSRHVALSAGDLSVEPPDQGSCRQARRLALYNDLLRGLCNAKATLERCYGSEGKAQQDGC
jgi:hypothetical protein